LFQGTWHTLLFQGEGDQAPRQLVHSFQTPVFEDDQLITLVSQSFSALQHRQANGYTRDSLAKEFLLCLQKEDKSVKWVISCWT